MLKLASMSKAIMALLVGSMMSASCKTGDCTHRIRVNHYGITSEYFASESGMRILVDYDSSNVVRMITMYSSDDSLSLVMQTREDGTPYIIDILNGYPNQRVVFEFDRGGRLERRTVWKGKEMLSDSLYTR